MREKNLFQSLQYVHKLAWRASWNYYMAFLLLSIITSFRVWLSLSAVEKITNSVYGLYENRIEIQTVALTILFFGLAEILLGICDLLKEKSLLRLNNSMNLYAKGLLNKKLSSIKMDYFEVHTTMVKIHDVKTRMEDVFSKYVKSIATYLTVVPKIIFFSYYLSKINIFYVLIYVFLFVIFNVLMGNKYKNLWSYWDSVQEYDQKQQYYFGLCGDKVSHQEYKINRLYRYFSDIWEKAYDECHKQRLRIFRKFEVHLQLSRIIFNIPYITMLLLIALEVAAGKQQIGFLIMANSLLNYIIDEYMSLQNNILDNRTDSRTITNYREVLEFEDCENMTTDCLHGDIHIEIPQYSYPQSENVALKNISLDIKEHEKIMIVGMNGSGKTTFVNILTSLLSSNMGAVTVNGLPVSLKQSVACIFQDFYQYQLSIKENILLGAPDREITEQELWEILAMVGLDKKVEMFPHGMDTKLGQLDNQGDFSKGEWQRLAVARLLAKRGASIWILDEPTAYLDPMSEIELYDMIYRCAGERLVIFISHRLGFAPKTDRILVFHKGEIVEAGTHEELVKKEGEYFDMWSIQAELYT